MVKGHHVGQNSLGALDLDVQNGLLGCGFSQLVFVLESFVLVLNGFLLSQLEVDFEEVRRVSDGLVNIVISFLCKPDGNLLGPGQRLGQREKVGVEFLHIGG